MKNRLNASRRRSSTQGSSWWSSAGLGAGEIKVDLGAVNLMLPGKDPTDALLGEHHGLEHGGVLWLSGTGKTIVSADPKRALLAMTSVDPSRDLQLRGQLLRQGVKLDAGGSRDLRRRRFGTILENVILDGTASPIWRQPPDREHPRLVPLGFIDSRVEESKADSFNVVFLCAGAWRAHARQQAHPGPSITPHCLGVHGEGGGYRDRCERHLAASTASAPFMPPASVPRTSSQSSRGTAATSGSQHRLDNEPYRKGVSRSSGPAPADAALDGTLDRLPMSGSLRQVPTTCPGSRARSSTH